MFARSRFDALTDGIFAMAMTLLVIDVRLPDATSPRDNSVFLAALLSLGPKLMAYALSFAVVGISWLAKITARNRSETVGLSEALLTLFYLFLVTLTPFSTMVLNAGALDSGRDSLPAVWIYCGNLGALGLMGALIQIARRWRSPADEEPWTIVSPLLLFVAGLLGAGVATLGLDHWAYAFLLTILGAPLTRSLRKRAKAEPA